MNSICRFRISSLSHLKLRNGSILNVKKGPISSVFNTCLLKPIIPVQIQFQSFWETFPSKVRSLHAKDHLDKESHELIYRTQLFNYAFYAQFVCLTAITLQAIGSTYFAIRSLVFNEVIQPTSDLGPFVIHYDAVSLLILIGFSCQFLFVYTLAQRPVLRMYYKEDTDEYVLVTLAKNPFKSRLLYCKPGELKALDVEANFVFVGTHKLNGIKLFLKPESIKTAWHYNRLVGFI